MSAATPEVSLQEAPAWLAGGGLLAFPTETVWGLGADARSETGVSGLRRFKRRTDASPISILVDRVAALPGLGFAPGPLALGLAGRFWPGPLTLVLPCEKAFAPGVARADGAVGVRCSPHPGAAALAQSLAAAGVGPVTATSLNRAGEPPARTRSGARAVCAVPDGPRILEGQPDAGQQTESTVLDLCGDRPRVLRWGAIDQAQLGSALAELAA